MASDYGIVSGGAFRFEPGAVLDSFRDQWPDAELVRPDDGIIEAYVYLPTSGSRPTEIRVHNAGTGIGVESGDDQEAAEIVAWIARTAPVPADGSVVLVHWADDMIPLTPETTAASLLSLRE